MILRCFSLAIFGLGMRQYRIFLISLLPHALIKSIIALYRPFAKLTKEKPRSLACQGPGLVLLGCG
jgi:hypothetical protein